MGTAAAVGIEPRNCRARVRLKLRTIVEWTRLVPNLFGKRVNRAMAQILNYTSFIQDFV